MSNRIVTSEGRCITVKLPLGLIEKIDEHVKNKENGFTSRADFIKYVIRLYFEKK